MEDDEEEIFTTLSFDITWEEITDGFGMSFCLSRFPEKEDIEEFLNRVGETATKQLSYADNGVEEFEYNLKDSFLQRKNATLYDLIDAYRNRKWKKMLEDIMDEND